ncbi:hypothetical protein VM1G_03210 [Cytospora mali]|uniref:Uncharacterized protein n=1 Tax=Cytospora mali TaxID=578113 RepID=A0A194VTJ3_CYTMA|nr:hypothetical protein VM1G_03210 [Valsa mali]
MSAHQNPPKRPRLSLQIKTIANGHNLRGSRTVAAAVNQASPTAFNTLSNVYATAIDRATPVTAIDTTQSLKLQTQNITQGKQHGAQTPFTLAYPETPLTAQPMSPGVAAQSVHFPNTMTATPPLSSGPVENDAKPFSFSAADTTGTSSSATQPTTTPTTVLPPPSASTPTGTARRRATKAARRVGYESPIEHVITTNHYVRSHIDLLAEDASPGSATASPVTATAAEAETEVQGQDAMVLDLTMAYTGNETRDGGVTPGPFEEMRRRMAGLVTRTPTSPSSGAGLSSPAGEDDLDDKEVGGAIAAIRAAARAQSGGDGQPSGSNYTSTPGGAGAGRAPLTVVVESNRQSPEEIPTPSIEVFDEAEVADRDDVVMSGSEAESVDEGGRHVSLATGDVDVDMITPTVIRKNDYLEPTPSGSVRQGSEGLFNSETGTRRDTPIPADLSPEEIPTPSIEVFDEAEVADRDDVVMSGSEAESVDEGGRHVSLATGDVDVDMITPTVIRKNDYLEPTPSGSVRQGSEGLFNSETGTRRDTPIPADLVPSECVA